jgi:hypothetical protein
MCAENVGPTLTSVMMGAINAMGELTPVARLVADLSDFSKQDGIGLANVIRQALAPGDWSRVSPSDNELEGLAVAHDVTSRRAGKVCPDHKDWLSR